MRLLEGQGDVMVPYLERLQSTNTIQVLNKPYRDEERVGLEHLMR